MVVREELVAALWPVTLRAECVSADWIAMCRGKRGRIEVGPLAVVAAENRVFWECPGKYRTCAPG